MRLGPESAQLLRRLALHDEDTFNLVFGDDPAEDDAYALPDKVHAVVSLVALVATGSSDASMQRVVTIALSAGVDENELIAALLAVAPIVGSARVSAGAFALASALGYEPTAGDDPDPPRADSG